VTFITRVREYERDFKDCLPEPSLIESEDGFILVGYHERSARN
jgi:hypothetical protein